MQSKHALSRALLGAAALVAVSIVAPAGAQAPNKRPLTFLDVQHMRQASPPTLSPDGRWALYTISTPDWEQARRQSDIYLVSAERGVASTRQLTFTKERNETSPRWSPDGSFFVFLSDRDAATTNGAGGQGGARAAAGGSRNQLFLMRPDGGEARRITDEREGVAEFAFSKDGKWLVYASGRQNEQQLHAFAMTELASEAPKPVQWTRHATGVGDWQFTRDGRTIYFTSPDTVDRDERLRMEKRFDVRVRNQPTPLASLWAFDVASRQERRLTRDTSFSVGSFTISDDGRWIGFRGMSADRYQRNVTEQNNNAELYLLEAATGKLERLTRNVDISESNVSFSPDSRLVAFSAPDDFRFMWNSKVYLRAVDRPQDPWRKLGGGFDGDVTVGFWSKDGKTIYFNEGIRATNQFLALDLASNTVRQITHEKAALNVDEDDSGRVLIGYSDPRTPPSAYTVASVSDVADRSRWVRLTDPNPWVADSIALGEEEEITWKSVDGRMVGGILVKPVGYRAGQRYPLIVAIHGGPASADLLTFNGGYGSQVYAGAGYAVLKPNYRNSTNYGQRHKIESQGDYFTKGYQDIMTGVDHLIAQGIVDSARMGALGWSAGGHWSNWILTHTDRFKAISSGAGTSNWISMYAESDMQRVRQWYLGDKLPYDDYDRWWNQSPMKYIRNARTPTMIHVVDGDPRVPRPQSEELHMALKKLGVPTEFLVYPGASHGIPDARNQFVKATAEMAWMDYWVRGSGRKFAWRDVLKTLEDSALVTMAGEPVP